MCFILLWRLRSSLLMHMRLFLPWATATNCIDSQLFLCFLKGLFFSSSFFFRLLVDMIPRIRQTRNYERFEWRTTEEKRAGEEGWRAWEGWRGANWVTGAGRGLPSPSVSVQTITFSPRGAGGGFSVCAVLTVKDLNRGSRQMTTASADNAFGTF